MGYKTNAVLKGAEVVGAKKGLRDDVQKFMHKDPKGKDDTYFAWVDKPNGKKKKVLKQIPDYIPEHDAETLRKAKRWAYKLDMGLFDLTLFQFNYRFGYSSLLGLVPEIGDTLEVLISSYFVVGICNRVQGGLPLLLLFRMALNILVDFLIGLVPVIGDLGDAAFRSNTRNVKKLEEYLMNKHGPRDVSLKKKKTDRYEDPDDVFQPYEKLQPQEAGVAHAGAAAAPEQTKGGRWGGLWGSRKERQGDEEMGRKSPQTDTQS